MAYNTTGKSHHNGVENEDKSKEWLEKNKNRHKSAPFLNDIKKVEKLGGTQNKSDLKICYNNNSTRGVSAKNISKNGATHDWVNTSKSDLLKESKHLEEVREYMKKIRALPLAERADYKQLFKEFRKERAKRFLNSLNHNKINGFLKEVFELIENQKIMINDKKLKKIQFYDGKDHPIFDYIDNDEWQFVLKQSRAVESASLFAVSQNDSSEINLHLRIRQATSNGDSAAIGLNEGKKGKNKYSSLVIKVQQDDLPKLYSELAAKNKLISF